MKLIGIILGIMTTVFALFKMSELSWWSFGLGIALGMAFFLIFLSFQPDKPAAVIDPAWENKFHELEAQSSQTIDGLNREAQKLQQKLLRTEERCLSYQKLVDVHQTEIDTLKNDQEHIREQLLQKERKLAEQQLARLEPDLFDV